MNYFLVAGEASGDLHGADLIEALRQHDAQAQFAFFGGDMMARAAGVEPIVHYRDMAYMGFTEVAKHLPKILGFLRKAKRAINEFEPAALVLIDYPSFNLKLAKYATGKKIQVHYFISPKVWVWKQWRVNAIRKYVDRMYCILPFEPAWYADHRYTAVYVGNPTVKEIARASASFTSSEDFRARHGLSDKPLIALLPGSRKQEIATNLPLMLEAARRHSDYQAVIAGAPALDDAVYAEAMKNFAESAPVLRDATYELVHNARAALVTSGTATLETALLGTPQVACYRHSGSRLVYGFYRMILKGNYVTLPNLILDDPLIPELLMHHCIADTIDEHLSALLPDGEARTDQLKGFQRLARRLTNADCATQVAQGIIASLV